MTTETQNYPANDKDILYRTSTTRLRRLIRNIDTNSHIYNSGLHTRQMVDLDDSVLTALGITTDDIRRLNVVFRALVQPR